MPRSTEQENFNEGAGHFYDLAFEKIRSGRMSIENPNRYIPIPKRFESEDDFETWEAYAFIDEALAVRDNFLNDPNNHWDSVQDRLMLRKKPKRERILKS